VKRMAVALVAALGLSGSFALVPSAVGAPPVGVGEWESRASSLIPREEGSFVEVNGRFYLGWGKDRTTQEVYDPATDTWQVAGTLPANLSHVQGVVVNGLVYFIGGFAFDPRREVGTVHIYDPSTGDFSLGAPMPAGRNRGAGGVTAWQGKIYYVGGLQNGVPVPWLDAYDPEAGTWTSLPDMPHARDHLAVQAADASVYAIGGRLGDPTLPVAATDRYDIAAGSWTTGLAPIPTPRAGAGIVLRGGELIVIGGSNDFVSLHDVEAYEIASDTWRALAPLPTARDGVQAVLWDGDVFVGGGGTLPRGTGPTDVLEVYVPDSTVRPDALVKPASTGAMLGGDVYNRTALGQSTTATAARGVTRVFRIRIENDGSTRETSTVHGSPARSSAFSVRYLKGATGSIDITSAVLAGTYTTAALARGEFTIVRVRVQVRSGAQVGSVQSCNVSVTSTTRPTSDDVVNATVRSV
jgi:hypothetical protein